MSTAMERDVKLGFALRVYAEPGSATECGKCRLGVGRVCTGFDKTLEPKPAAQSGAWHLRQSSVAPIMLRLSECVDAQRRAECHQPSA